MKTCIKHVDDKKFNEEILEEKNSRYKILNLSRFYLQDIDFELMLREYLNSNDFDSTAEYCLILNSNFFAKFKNFVFPELPIQIIEMARKIKIAKVIINNPPDLVIQSFKDNDYFDIFDEERKSYTLDIEKIKILKENLNKNIIGQAQVIRHVLIAISRYMYSKDTKPLVLGFIGPQGVGKTDMANTISDTLFPNGTLFREQMSMLNNGTAQEYLFGGNIADRTFSKSLLQRRSEVLLLDEFNLVNPIFFSAFYQMFDEGKFVDGNYTINLNKAIIICTGNYRSREEMVADVMPPLYSRFSDVCVFKTLNRSDFLEIAQKHLDEKMNNINEEFANLINEQKIMDKIKELPLFSDVRSLDHVLDQLIGNEILIHKNIF